MTVYPAQIDNTQTLPTAIDDQTPVRGVVVNQLRDAILSVEGALGVQPGGIYGNVAARLLTIESTIGNLRSISLSGDLGGTYDTPLVIGIQGYPVSSAAPSVGDILVWNGIAWVPSDVASHNVFFAAGDLAGNGFSQTVIGLQTHPVSATTPTTGQVLEWNGTSWTPTNISSVPSGPAGGDLAGTYPNPTIGKLQGRNLSAASPSVGQVLQYNGAAWVPATFTGGITQLTGDVTAGPGTGSVPATVVTSGGFPIITSATNAGGDLTGSYPAPTLSKLQGVPVLTTGGNAPSSGQALGYNGSSWVPITVSFSGATAGGDLSGTYPNPTVAKLRGFTISGVGPGNGQALVYQGFPINTWSPESPSGDLSGTFPNPTVIAIQGNAIQPGALSAVDDGYFLSWVNAASQWRPVPGPSGSFSAGHDLSGSSFAQTVVGIQGNQVVAGTPTTGNALRWNGTEWQGLNLNLAGGSGYVTGVLPTANQAAQSVTLTGDATGTGTTTSTATTVSRLQGSITLSGTPSSGQVLTATSSTAANWQTVSSGITQLTGDGTAGPGSGSQALTVTAIHGTSVPATPSANQVLVATSGTAATWEQISNAQVSISAAVAVSKLASGTSGQVLLSSSTPTPTWTTVSGDALISSTGAVTVQGFNGILLSGSPSNGQVYQYNGTNWVPATISGTFTPGGDLSGTSSSQTVIGIQGISVPSPSGTNTVLTYNAGAYTWSAGGGGSGITQLTGDVTAGPGSGSQAATVVAINGTSVSATPSANQVLVATSGTTSTWEQISNAQVSNTAAIAGTKISPAFGSQNISTSGTLSAGGATVTSIQDTGLSTGVVHSDASGNFTSSSVVNADVSATAGIVYSKLNLTGNIVNTDISNTAAIAYSKLNLTGDIVNSDVSNTAAIAYSKLNLTGDIVNADISNTAAIAYSKLNLTGSVVNADIATAANIAVSKLAAGTDGYILQTNGSGVPTWTNVTGDASISTSGVITVLDIHGASVPVAGSLTTGNVLQVNGSSSLTYAAVNLAGGSNYVTGVLPTANQAAQTMSGDVTGTTASNTIVNVSGTGGIVTFGATIQGNATGSGYPISYTIANVVMPSDADYTLTAAQLVCPILIVTTSGSLTATRNIILPAQSGAKYDVYNHTSGGQSLQFIASTGTGITIPNGLKSTVYFNGTNYVTSDIVVGGDLSASSNIAQTVAKIQGTPVSVTTPTTSQLLQFTGGQWTPTTISSLPPNGPAGGDLSGTYPNPVVAQLQTYPVSSAAPSSNQVLTWDSGDGYWRGAAPAPTTPIGPAGGDLTGTYPNPTVANINGSSVPASGTYAIGNVLQANGSSSITYGPVNLAGGANYITGVLPAANLPNASISAKGIIQLATDLGGTATAPTVIGLSGTPIVITSLNTGNGLYYDGTEWANSPLNLSGGSHYVTGVLPNTNQQPQGMGGDVSGPTNLSTVIAIQSHAIKAQSLGAAQDGYVLTWSFSNNDWEAEIPTGAGGSIPVGSAGGDLGGTYPAPEVVGLQGNHVSNLEPTDGYVLTWVAMDNAWEPLPSASAGGAFPVGPASGDLGGTYPHPLVLQLDSVPLNYSTLTNGNALVYSGGNWINSAINLAGGSASVTGVLPVANLPNASTIAKGVVQLAGDLGGTATSPAVLQINGTTVPVGGSLTTGNVLQVNGASSLTYSAVDLAGGSNYVTGILPAGNLPLASPTASGIIKLAGDLGGTSASPSVLQINGATVPVAGSLTTGNGLYVTGASALSYGPLNLAGGAGYVTGVLPTGNQAAQTMGGNVTGTTASATVIAINSATVPAAGSLTTGNVLQVSGSSALTYGPLNLAGGANYVTGVLPAGNMAAQSLFGDVTGSTSGLGTTTVSKLQGNTLALPTLGASEDGYVLTWNNLASELEMEPVPAASANDFVFRPGGTAHGNVYISETALATAVSAANGRTNVVFDLSLVGNNYTFTTVGNLNFGPNCTWTDGGMFGGINFLNGTTLSYAPNLSGTIVVLCGQGTPIVTWTGFYGTISIAEQAIVYGGTFVQIQSGATFEVFLRDNASCYETYSSPVFHNTGGTGIYNVEDGAKLGAGAVDSDSIRILSSGAVVDSSLYSYITLVQGLFVDLSGTGTSGITAVGSTGNLLFSSGVLYESNGTFWVPTTSTFTAGGDLTGTSTSQTVSKIQTVPINLAGIGAGQDGYVLTYNYLADLLELEAPGGGSSTLAGDVTGTSNDNYVGQRKSFLLMGA